MTKLKEPLVDVTSDLYNTQLAYAFSYYNMEKDKKDAMSFMKTYLKTIDVNKFNKFEQLPESSFIQTYGWLARIKSNGYNLSKDHDKAFDTYVNELMQIEVEKPVQVEAVVKPSIQDYMKEKTKEYIGELEGILDDILKSDTTFSLYNDLKAKTIPKQYCDDIQTWIDKKTLEFVEAYKAVDGDIKEGYSNIGKRKLTQFIKLLQQFEEDLNKYAEFKKANRKPRVKKAKPASVQVSKMKYKKEDTEARVVSISPSEMVGASQVWVYNTRYKKLAVYRSESTMGIQVKGSSLHNYDPALCEQKVVRRPEAFLPIILSATKIKLRKIMDELTTKGSDVSGRINEECIILRAIK